MREEEQRPTRSLVGISSTGGYIGSGRQIRPIIGPDDEETRRRLHTPEERRDVPRDLTEIFRRT